ncbi:HotDog domain-containing protein [Desarmillaria ectypa]|nr:HotDog domain-containing protein [Desarmillaria ectypa]
MSARSSLLHASTSTSTESPLSVPSSRSSRMTPESSAWVDPASLPDHGDVSATTGNVGDDIKRLNYNTYFSYGVGDEDCFGYQAGKDVKFVDINVDRRLEHHGRLEATTIAEVIVSKNMLNGAGMLHGGCITYLIDNTPLVVLGLVQGVNGVGVTQGMNVLFHSPASLGARIRIISTSVSLGGRVMTSRCEIINKDTGRIIASAFLNKMQPNMSKL